MLPILDTVLYVLFILAHLSQQQIKCFFAFLPPGLSRYTAKLPKVGSGQYTTRQGLAREISALLPFGTYIKHGNTGETMFDIPYIAIFPIMFDIPYISIVYNIRNMAIEKFTINGILILMGTTYRTPRGIFRRPCMYVM